MKKLFVMILSLTLVLSFAGCAARNGSAYKLENSDTAKGFYNTYKIYEEKYGKANESSGVLSGTSVVRLYDFTGDGTLEMLIAYSSQKDGKTDSLMICGFDLGTAELYNEKLAEGADELWIYTDRADLSYLVLGDDLSKEREYLYYRYTDDKGKPLYKFSEAFTTDGEDLGGTYEKISLTNADSDAVFAENDRVIKSLENQKN